MTKRIHRGKRALRRGVALAVALLMMIVVPTGKSPLKAQAATDVSALESELADLRNQSTALQNQINALQNNLSNTKERLQIQQQKAAVAEKLVNTLNAQIEQLNGDIRDKEAAIAVKEQEILDREADIADRKELLKDRLQAISKSGNLSSFQMLFNTDSYADYLIKSKMMERSSERDKALMDELEAEIQAINAEKAALDADKAQLADEKAELEPLKAEAEQNAKELEQLCASIARDQQSLTSQIAAALQTQANLDKESERIRKEIEASKYEGKFSKMYWPVPAVKNISSQFGTRWGANHKGIDVSEGFVPVFGQSIYAAADGVVTRAYTADTWGGGFGYHVVIDHGKDANGVKITTLYAHCSQLLVKVGQQVVGGETVIAKVGRTGDVTGPHLHFEVWENGVPVDPVLKGYVPNYYKDKIIG